MVFISLKRSVRISSVLCALISTHAVYDIRQQKTVELSAVIRSIVSFGEIECHGLLVTNFARIPLTKQKIKSMANE